MFASAVLAPLSVQGLSVRSCYQAAQGTCFCSLQWKLVSRKWLASLQLLTEEIQYLLENTEGENGGVASRILGVKLTPLSASCIFHSLCLPLVAY